MPPRFLRFGAPFDRRTVFFDFRQDSLVLLLCGFERGLNL
jgi:hypothetical protein